MFRMTGVSVRAAASVVAAATMLGAPTAFAQSARSITVSDLGTAGGYASSAAGSVNERGVVAGFLSSASTNAAPGTTAVLWDGSQTRMLAGESSVAAAVNRHGVSVGYANVGGAQHAVEWAADGKSHDLGTLAGGAWSQATDINNHGQVVGYAATPGGTHAFVSDGSTLRDLGTLTGGFSYAYAINASGVVAGSASGNAVTWTANGAINVLAGGGQRSLAYGLNDRGAVVGAVDGRPAWWNGATEQPLFANDKPLFGRAAAINAQDWIVGNVQLTDATGMPVYHAVVWRNGAMCDLNNLVDPASGWTLIDATAINDADVIVGMGSHQGQQRAFSLQLTHRAERGC